MVRIAVLGLVGFLLGLGGATGIVVAREKEARVVAVAHADSVTAPADSAAAAHGGAAHGLAEPNAPHGAPAGDAMARADSPALANASATAAHAEPVTPSVSHEPELLAGSAAAPPVPTTQAPAPALPDRRVAKIFAAMQPKDAARVLEQMSDADIQTILGFLGDRQAAALLGSLSPQRAAAVSQAFLRGRRDP